MPLFAKNIIVGDKKSPTVVNQNDGIGSKLTFFGKNTNQSEPVQKRIKMPEVVETKDESKYLYKQDGDLIRHINKKSDYLRDILEIE
jgi:hypothetical protein